MVPAEVHLCLVALLQLSTVESSLVWLVLPSGVSNLLAFASSSDRPRQASCTDVWNTRHALIFIDYSMTSIKLEANGRQRNE